MEKVSYIVKKSICIEAKTKEDLPMPDEVKETVLYELNECIEKHTDWNATINKISVM